MNEQVARDVVLVRAIESADQNKEVLTEDDRLYASRSAKELAQWHAAGTKSEMTTELFLQQRAEQIIKRLSERMPLFAAVLKRRNGMKSLGLVLPVLALFLGAVADRIGDPHRVDLLSAPLLLIIGWNLMVYLGLMVAIVVPGRSKRLRESALVRRLTLGRSAVPRKLPHALSAGIFNFMAEWTQLNARLTLARISRTVHLSAAVFAIGAMLSLYARGFLTQYVAGWESTFLDAAQVHTILSLLFAPAMALFPLQGFTLADIEALPFGRAARPAVGAQWVHLYAATLFLLVVLPRIVLAIVAHWRASWLAGHVKLDFNQPYFRKLDPKIGSLPGVLRVLPYSFTVDEARDQGLNAIAVQLLGENARVMLRPAAGYGEDIATMRSESKPGGKAVSQSAILFNLAATPEKENHGAFIEQVQRETAAPPIVLIDESGYLERAGVERGAERVALWREFCNFHGARAIIVNLLDPMAHPVEVSAI